MSWLVSTCVCAGTLLRSTPDPSSGVAPTTSTSGRVMGVGAPDWPVELTVALGGEETWAPAGEDRSASTIAGASKIRLSWAIPPSQHRFLKSLFARTIKTE